MSELENAIDAIRDGQLVVLPTDTSYAVFADAFNRTAIASLRIARKQQQVVSIPVAGSSIEMISGVAQITGLARDLAGQFWPGPLTLLVPAQATTPLHVGGLDDALSVRVPHHEDTQAVISGTGPLAFTGAHNVGGSPALTIETARSSFGDSVAVYVDRGELPGSASSVVDATGSTLRMLREGTLSLETLRQVMPMIVDARASH